MNDGLEQDLWHVEASPGDVKVVTLDQLDEAFQQGLVNENTRVWQEGMPEAMTLAELLGGEDDESAETEKSAAADHELERYQPEPQPTLIGLSAADVAPPSYGAPASMRPEPDAYASPPVRAEAPAPRASMYPPPNVATPAVSVAPSYPRVADTGSAWPPVVTRSAPPAASAPASIPPAPVLRRPQVSETAGAWPPVVTRSAPPPSSSNSDSLRPVMAPSVPPPSLASTAMPMAFDLDDAPFARKSGKGKVIFGAFTALAAAAGVAFAVNSGAIALPSSSEAPGVAAAAAPPPAPEPPKSHAFDPGSAPVHINDAPPPLAITTRANEDANLAAAIGKKLGVTGKSAAPKTAVHAPAKSSRRTGNTSGGGFKTRGKGSVYDPLNGAL